jgi:hypothetical protein
MLLLNRNTTLFLGDPTLKIKLFLAALLVSVFALTPLAKADSISFVSHVGNDYTYDLTLDSHATAFILDGFTVTGLSGVTDAVLGGQLAQLFNPLGGIAFNSTSVAVGTIFGLSVSSKDPYSLGTLTITSASLPGDADFSILDTNGLFCGSVTGPTGDPSPVPEPSSFVLLGSGLLAAAGAARRKLLA